MLNISTVKPPLKMQKEIMPVRGAFLTVTIKHVDKWLPEFMHNVYVIGLYICFMTGLHALTLLI